MLCNIGCHLFTYVTENLYHLAALMTAVSTPPYRHHYGVNPCYTISAICWVRPDHGLPALVPHLQSRAYSRVIYRQVATHFDDVIYCNTQYVAFSKYHDTFYVYDLVLF